MQLLYTNKLHGLFFLLLISVFGKAQVLEKYPPGQSFYKGGTNILEKEIKSLALQLGLRPCENISESYDVAILVNKDASINFVKDFDTAYIAKNKCAYDFTRKILPQLKGWIPAKLGDTLVKAIATFNIQPYYVFNDRPIEVPAIITQPVYEKGNERFIYIVRRLIENDLTKNTDGRMVSIDLVINEEGKIEEAQMANMQIEEASKKKLETRIREIKGKWKPATKNGIPIKYVLRLNFRQKFDFDTEKERFDEMEKGNKIFHNNNRDNIGF